MEKFRNDTIEHNAKPFLARQASKKPNPTKMIREKEKEVNKLGRQSNYSVESERMSRDRVRSRSSTEPSVVDMFRMRSEDDDEVKDPSPENDLVKLEEARRKKNQDDMETKRLEEIKRERVRFENLEADRKRQDEERNKKRDESIDVSNENSIKLDDPSNDPKNWKEFEDASGNKFFFNSVTRKTAWELPDVVMNKNYQVENAKEEDGEWVPYFNEEGQKYFYNKITGDTKWAYDTDMIGESKDEWKEIVDEQSGTYFYNTITGQSSWENPNEEEQNNNTTPIPDDFNVAEEIISLSSIVLTVQHQQKENERAHESLIEHNEQREKSYQLQLYNIQQSINAHSQTLKQLVSGEREIPSLIYLVPKKKTFFERCNLDPKAWFEDEMRLVFLCGHDHRVVECGPNKDGYRVERPKDWVIKYQSVLRASLWVLKGLSIAGRFVGIPLPTLEIDGNIVNFNADQVITGVIDSLAEFGNDVAETLDDHLEGNQPTNFVDTKRVTGEAFLSLKEFIREQDPGLKHVGLVRVESEESGNVEWVLDCNVDKWKESERQRMTMKRKVEGLQQKISSRSLLTSFSRDETEENEDDLVEIKENQLSPSIKRGHIKRQYSRDITKLTNEVEELKIQMEQQSSQDKENATNDHPQPTIEKERDDEGEGFVNPDQEIGEKFGETLKKVVKRSDNTSIQVGHHEDQIQDLYSKVDKIESWHAGKYRKVLRTLFNVPDVQELSNDEVIAMYHELVDELEDEVEEGQEEEKTD